MIIGIDLGTTYSVAAYLDGNGIPQIITNSEGEEMTPSVVYVDGEDVVVGTMAKQKGLRFPDKVCRCVKMNMGNRQVVMKDEENEYSPEIISAMILKRIINDAERRLGEPVEGVVITVPTYFDDAKRTATKNAIDCLEVPLIGMVDEPKAAGACYCYQNAMEEGKILVYDFGGGTFDTTLLEVKEGAIEIIAEGGEHEAGGAYFDEAIRDYVIEQVLEQHEINLKDAKYSNVREEILNDAEICKKQLSIMEESSILVRCPEGAMEISITRDTFNELIDNMVYRTISVIEEMLEQKGLMTDDVDKVLLVGGSSQIPYVREQLYELFEKELSEKIDPAKAVAYGAAVYADMVKDEAKQKLRLSDVCAHGIGVIRRDKEDHSKRINDVLIQPNTPIPTSVEAWYELSVDGQRVIDLELTEGEFADADSVHIISKMKIELPHHEKLQAGTPVGVQLKINQNHMIEVFLNIPSVGLHEEYKIKRIDNMTDEQFTEMSGLLKNKKIR